MSRLSFSLTLVTRLSSRPDGLPFRTVRSVVLPFLTATNRSRLTATAFFFPHVRARSDRPSDDPASAAGSYSSWVATGLSRPSSRSPELDPARLSPPDTSPPARVEPRGDGADDSFPNPASRPPMRPTRTRSRKRLPVEDLDETLTASDGTADDDGRRSR